jgi:PTHB1 N-terminus
MGHVSAENIILATDTGSLLVYKGLQLVWSAKLKSTPVCIAVSAFGSTPGMIVALDETGQVRESDSPACEAPLTVHFQQFIICEMLHFACTCS